MTFGQTLKQLLTVSGVKSAHLARALGYDTSYISRWVNDSKLPSLHNNDSLFQKIAEYIVMNSSEDACNTLHVLYENELCDNHYENNCDEHFDNDYGNVNDKDKETQEKLQIAIASALTGAYEKSVSDASFSGNIWNASFVTGVKAEEFENQLAEAVANCMLQNRKKEVECISYAPLNDIVSENIRGWDGILDEKEIRGDAKIVIRQMINMEEFSRNIDSYCSAICACADYREEVRYEFYMDESEEDTYPVQFMMVEDAVLVQCIKMPISGSMNTITCTDASVLKPNYQVLKNKLANTRRMLKYCKGQELFEGHFLLNFLMDGKIKYLLNIMHPIYMTRDFVGELFDQYAEKDSDKEFQIQYNSMCSDTPKKVIIFRSAMLEYIYEGKLFVFGQVLYLTREERTRHLRQLLENMEQGDCALMIIDDNNPLICREDMNMALYLSRSTGFAVSMTVKDRMIKLASNRVAQYFNIFFDHLENMPERYRLCGKVAEEFIRKGLQLL